ncbi:DUF1343 domain-containing protein [Chitinophaga sedimenti]|uniref:exo-beta-N-acetylmuramidase NamZ domain-containing protein n=1 Tax=Chitinophaga sedimenti TaxID=2033606 RepID=UPI00200342FB|nr:exo-beta-N-acetylmuramidase NamZ domain-containing protein [Chitinophaga sedimenti]MCK7553517.1 DUF1343 domain-containing protein [Chitinophaga sedimenti]
MITCKGYTHKTRYALPVKPSPNLPNMQSIYLYPGTCLFEGTQLSLGRGTDKPFQVFGHPDLPKNLYQFTPRSVAGAKNPPLLDKVCYGYDLSKDKPADKVELSWILKAYSLFPDKAKFFNSFFNKLAGNSTLQEQIKAGKSETEIRASWAPGLAKFKAVRKRYLLYTDFE